MCGSFCITILLTTKKKFLLQTSYREKQKKKICSAETSKYFNMFGMLCAIENSTFAQTQTHSSYSLICDGSYNEACMKVKCNIMNEIIER